jgi:hypothetical protein
MICQKQNRYKAALKNEWEELGVDPREIRTRLSAVNGGVSFDEFLFLRKGKSDREKLISLVFYASFLPKMMPYMLMFNSGNMLPDQFPKKPISFGETKREALSRERCSCRSQNANEPRSKRACSRIFSEPFWWIEEATADGALQEHNLGHRRSAF